MKKRDIIKALSDPEEFKRIISGATALSIVKNDFPEYAKELITPILSNPDEFKRIIDDATALSIVKDDFPEYAKELITPILSNPDEFRRIVTSATSLSLLKADFPEYAKELITPILANPDEFRRIVTCAASLSLLKEDFPEYAILHSGTHEEILDTLIREREYAQANTSARLLGEASRDEEKQSPFSRLDKHLLFKITEDTVDKTKTDPKELKEVFEKAFEKPKKK